MRTIFAFIGPQGSGKGTQAQLLAKKLGYELLVMGDILRDTASHNTEEGTMVNSYLLRGELVPDKSTIQLFEESYHAFKNPRGVILDGFPRTITQAIYLDGLEHVTAVVYFALMPDVAVKRIAGRRVCAHGHNFNVYYVRPKQEGVCDIDGLPLSVRADDTEAAVQKRLAVYMSVTTKVIDHYRTQDKLFEVDAAQSVDHVQEAVDTIIKKYAH